MQVMWVLVAVKMVSGLSSGGQEPVGSEVMPHWQRVTAGVFASEAQCRTAATALGRQSGIKPLSAQCQPERLQ